MCVLNLTFTYIFKNFNFVLFQEVQNQSKQTGVTRNSFRRKVYAYVEHIAHKTCSYI